eukprot:scaffold32628_cov104-Isochrysis_galbana.AAC.2
MRSCGYVGSEQGGGWRGRHAPPPLLLAAHHCPRLVRIPQRHLKRQPAARRPPRQRVPRLRPITCTQHVLPGQPAGQRVDVSPPATTRSRLVQGPSLAEGCRLHLPIVALWRPAAAGAAAAVMLFVVEGAGARRQGADALPMPGVDARLVMAVPRKQRGAAGCWGERGGLMFK